MLEGAAWLGSEMITSNYCQCCVLCSTYKANYCNKVDHFKWKFWMAVNANVHDFFLDASQPHMGKQRTMEVIKTQVNWRNYSIDFCWCSLKMSIYPHSSRVLCLRAPIRLHHLHSSLQNNVHKGACCTFWLQPEEPSSLPRGSVTSWYSQCQDWAEIPV